MTEPAPPRSLDPALERKLAATVHLLGLLALVLAPLAAALAWGRRGSPWLRRHLRDAFLHWAAALVLFLGALGFETMDPVHDFGLVRVAALDLGPYFSLSRNFGAIAWGASLPFALLSARRAARGQPSLYPLTLWWGTPRAPPAETLESEEPERPGMDRRQ